jgi:hypothetical protein
MEYVDETTSSHGPTGVDRIRWDYCDGTFLQTLCPTINCHLEFTFEEIRHLFVRVRMFRQGCICFDLPVNNRQRVAVDEPAMKARHRFSGFKILKVQEAHANEWLERLKE